MIEKVTFEVVQPCVKTTDYRDDDTLVIQLSDKPVVRSTPTWSWPVCSPGALIRLWRGCSTACCMPGFLLPCPRLCFECRWVPTRRAQAVGGWNGLMTGTPKLAKSVTLRVTTVSW